MIPRQNRGNQRRPRRHRFMRTQGQRGEKKFQFVSRKMDTREKEKEHRSVFSEYFRKFAHKASVIVGSPWAFTLALLTIIIWAILGPAFGYSDTWQLVINTATTIITFQMVFLIQNTQNRDAKAMHLKLDELLYAVKGARNQLIDLEDMSDEDLDALQKEFERFRRHRSREQEKQEES